MNKNSFEAELLHTPFDKEDAYHSLSMPVYNTAAYEFDTAEAMEEAFCGRTADHAYSRLTNPTVQYFEKRIQTITGALSVCDLTNPEAVRAQVDENTCAVFLEVITNPQLEVADLKVLSGIAHQIGAPLIADTTVVPFHIFHANEFGVDIEIVSSTKYISGGATSLGGLILDYGTFDWSNSKKLRSMADQFGTSTFTAKLRKEIHRNLGAYMTPQVA